MTAASNAERASFAITATPVVGPIRYAAVGQCAYLQNSTAPAAPPSEQISITVRTVRNSLLVTIVESKGTSTAIIGTDGSLQTFNLVNAAGGRDTPSNYNQRAADAAARYTAQYGSTAHMINNFAAVYPHYLKPSWNPGDTVATLESEGGRPWAVHVYRGITSYKGRRAALIDIVRTLDSAPAAGPLVVGWALVDTTTMAPLLFALDAGWKARLERLSCTGKFG